MWVALIPILAVFFLADGGKFAQRFIDEFDRRDQRACCAALSKTSTRCWRASSFRRSLVAGLSLCAYSIVLTLLSFPYALALAVAGGIMELYR